MSHNLAALFDTVASSVSDREAIVLGNEAISYGEVQDRVRRFANHLLASGLGVRKERADLERWQSGQSHVGLYLINCSAYLECAFGAHAARCVPFNINYRYTATELASLLNDANAEAVVFHAQFVSTIAAALPLLNRPPMLIQVKDGSGQPLLDGAQDYGAVLAASSSSCPQVELSPDDLHILYTGGTTGMPKGTMWRQADLFASVLSTVVSRLKADTGSADSIASATAALRPERVMPLPPFMHGASYWVALGALVSGDTLILQTDPARLDTKDVWRTVERQKVRAMTVVGEAFLRPLCEELEHGRYDTASLHRIVTGGAATTVETKVRLLRLLPHVLLIDAGGASESGRQLMRVARHKEVGTANLFNAEPGTCVVSEDKSTRLTPGHEGSGWLARSGPLPLGYLNDHVKSDVTFPVCDGERMSIPGDRARLLANGMIELLGRDSASINTGGEKVFAEEVEQALLRHPDVLDAVVVGRPSQRWGQEVVAVVQFRHGVRGSEQELILSTSDVLARYKQPKAILSVEAMVRTPSGKPDYPWAQKFVTQQNASSDL